MSKRLIPKAGLGSDVWNWFTGLFKSGYNSGDTNTSRNNYPNGYLDNKTITGKKTVRVGVAYSHNPLLSNDTTATIEYPNGTVIHAHNNPRNPSKPYGTKGVFHSDGSFETLQYLDPKNSRRILDHAKDQINN